VKDTVILIYIQQDATLHILCYLKTALHISGGTFTHHQERKQLYLQQPLLLLAAIVKDLERSSNYSTIAAGISNGVTNTVYILEYFYDARTHELQKAIICHFCVASETALRR
jgi:hypothetical protein